MDEITTHAKCMIMMMSEAGNVSLVIIVAVVYFQPVSRFATIICGAYSFTASKSGVEYTPVIEFEVETIPITDH